MTTLDEFDPVVLDDPVAMDTAWTPLSRCGASFCTHKLHHVNAGRIEFKMTTGVLLFTLLFAVIGVALLVAAIIKVIDTGQTGDSWIMGFIGLVFSAVGVFMFYSMSTRSVIDTSRGLYWKGHRDPPVYGNSNTSKTCTDLDSIHAIQIISKIAGNETTYHSYELNFILHDGERIPVIDHGNHQRIRQDADTVSRILDIPVWDAS